MRRWLASGSTALVLLLALPAISQESGLPDPARPGLYAGLDAPYGVNLFGGTSSGGSITGGDSWGWGFRFGYRAHRFLALEGQIENPVGFDVRVNGVTVGKIDPMVVTLNARGYFPIGDFHPYALLGAGVWQPGLQDNTLPGIAGSVDSQAVLKAGGGLDFWITDNLAAGVNAVYTKPFAGTGSPEFDYLSVGFSLQYTFRFAEDDDW